MFGLDFLIVLSVALIGSFSLAHPLTPDGPLAGEHENEIGPIQPELFEQNPTLVYLGPYNGKNWYIVRSNDTLYGARWNCVNMGMKLARFENIDELQFIANSTTDGDDQAWSDGEVIPSVSSYSWGGSGTPIRGFALRNDDRLGLTIGRYLYPHSSRLVTENVFSRHYYVCYYSV